MLYMVNWCWCSDLSTVFMSATPADALIHVSPELIDDPHCPHIPIAKAYVPKSKMKRTFVYADGVKVLHRITNKSLTKDGWADCDGVTVHCPTKWNPASEQMPRALNHDDKPVYTKQVLRGLHGCLCGTSCKARKIYTNGCVNYIQSYKQTNTWCLLLQACRRNAALLKSVQSYKTGLKSVGRRGNKTESCFFFFF